MNHKEEIAKLHLAIQEDVTYRIICNFCTKEGEYHDPNKGINSYWTIEEHFYMQGWREKDSDFYQLMGIACPTCAKKTDKQMEEEYDN